MGSTPAVRVGRTLLSDAFDVVFAFRLRTLENCLRCLSPSPHESGIRQRQVKSVGQECPTHTASYREYRSRSSVCRLFIGTAVRR